MEAVIFFKFFAGCRRYVNKAVHDGTSLIIRSDYGNAVLMAEDEYKCIMKMAHESLDLKIELNKYEKTRNISPAGIEIEVFRAYGTPKNLLRMGQLHRVCKNYCALKLSDLLT